MQLAYPPNISLKIVHNLHLFECLLWCIFMGEVYAVIIYDKLFVLLKEKGYNTTRIRKEMIIGQRTLTALKNGTGGINHQTIDNLCRVLECQPGDLMEYVANEEFRDKGRRG